MLNITAKDYQGRVQSMFLALSGKAQRLPESDLPIVGIMMHNLTVTDLPELTLKPVLDTTTATPDAPVSGNVLEGSEIFIGFGDTKSFTRILRTGESTELIPIHNPREVIVSCRDGSNVILCYELYF